MKIPKRFKLMGQTITVEFDAEKFAEKDGVFGLAIYRQNKIILRPSSSTTPLTEDQIGSTFCHEIMHFVTYNSGASYDPENAMHRDEDFIDLSGELLYQILSSMEYK